VRGTQPAICKPVNTTTTTAAETITFQCRRADGATAGAVTLPADKARSVFRACGGIGELFSDAGPVSVCPEIFKAAQAMEHALNFPELNPAKAALQHHVSGAIERGEAIAIAGQPDVSRASDGGATALEGHCTRCGCSLSHPKHPARRCTLKEWRAMAALGCRGWSELSDEERAAYGDRTAPAKRTGYSFDGCGINGCDEYGSRLATLTDAGHAAKVGELFAAAPELLAALSLIVSKAYMPQGANPAHEDYHVHPNLIADAHALLARLSQ